MRGKRAIPLAALLLAMIAASQPLAPALADADPADLAAATQEQTRLDGAFDRLVEMEAGVEAARESVARAGFASAEVTRKLGELKALLGADAIETIRAGELDRLDPRHRAALDRFVAWMKEADAAQVALHDRYDLLGKMQLEYLTDQGVATARLTRQRLAAELARPDRELDRLFRGVEEAYAAYLKTIPLFGTPKDTFRKRAMATLSKALRAYHAGVEGRIRKLPEARRARNPAERATLRSTIDRLGRLVEAWKHSLVFTRELLPVLGEVFGPARAERPGELRMARAVNRMINRYAEAVGTWVELEGTHHVPALVEGERTVNVYVPTHRSAQLVHDEAVLARLAPPDTMTFVGLVVPPPLMKWLDRPQAMIAVGRKTDPVAKALRGLDSGASRNIWIFPEGGIPAGVEETMPVRAKFAPGFIERIEKAGYRINLIPVTLRDAATFADQLRKEKTLRTIIHEPIDSGSIALLRQVDPQAVSHHLRSIWMEHLPTDRSRLMGMLRPERARKDAIRFVTGRGASTGCLRAYKKLLAAPPSR